MRRVRMLGSESASHADLRQVWSNMVSCCTVDKRVDLDGRVSSSAEARCSANTLAIPFVPLTMTLVYRSLLAIL